MTSQQPTAGSDQRWEQPSFVAGSPEPEVAGRVISVLPHQLPTPSSEERLWRSVRTWIWPAFIVLGLVTGSWAPTWLAVVALFIIAGKRIRQLERERRASLLR